MANIGWTFPSGGYATDEGFNNQIAFLEGKPIRHYLPREVIQNSLDARADKSKPVIVKFEAIKVSPNDFPGRVELLADFRECRKEEKGQEKAERFFTRGIKILQGGGGIECLRISDSNTSGLRGKDDRKGQWHNLVKATGRSGDDKTRISGGSFGIGKFAPFAASRLRTVFYSTSYKEGGKIYRCAQGKAILTSHKLPDGDLSLASGFYGVNTKFQPIANHRKIPPFMRREEEEDGTTLIISGFYPGEGWEKEIAAAIAANFFCAVHDGKLQVDVGGIVVNAETLDSLFNDDALWLSDDEAIEFARDEAFARHYYRAFKEGKFEEMQHLNLGHTKLWILVDDNVRLPKRTAIFRETGMMITDKQAGFQFRGGFRDFAAVCICEGKEGNAMLRAMENPEHDQFEPARLDEDESKGKKMLTELKNWVRLKITEHALPVANDVVPLRELAKLLPDFDSEGRLAGEPNAETETDIEGAPVLRTKRIKRPKVQLPKGEDEEEGDEHSQEGNGKRRRKKRKVNPKASDPMPIEDVRILALDGDGKKKKVIFTPLQSGSGSVEIRIAGDSFSERLKTVAAVDLREGERHSLEIKFDRPVSDSFIVAAFAKKEKK